MVKTFVNEKKRTTVAVVSGGRTDAYAQVAKRLGMNEEKYRMSLNGDLAGFEFAADKLHLKELLMPEYNTGVVRCDERDEYDAEEGKRQAIAKADRNYMRSFEKAILRWQVAVMQELYRISPETFNEAAAKVAEQ